jgi:aldose 1-epimerase
VAGIDEVRLELDGQIATVARRGARLRTYTAGGLNVVAGVEDPAGPYAYRSALLVPWPNRVTGGRWSWEGEELQLEVNETGLSALHGLVHGVDFAVTEQSPTSVTLEHELAPTAGYPFGLLVSATYALTGDGLHCALAARNVSERRAPVGLGVHPYLAAPGLVDSLEVTVAAETVLLTDEQWQEVGRVRAELLRGEPVGDRVIDAAFTDVIRDADGRVTSRMRAPGSHAIEVWGGATCRWLVVYTGHGLMPSEARRSMCIEPQTCPPNALVTGEDLDILEPGQTAALDWGLRVIPE